jgi:uncharacterized LabA/DUF88 family protein
MTSEVVHCAPRLINTIVYIDYENISKILKQVSKDPLDMMFFRVIQEKLQEAGLKVIDFIVYSNFEKGFMSQRLQTLLRGIGIQARQASNHKKSSGDLELSVDALQTLYKNPNISAFAIISSDQDLIPLLKAIKSENKLSFVFSTKNGFNQLVAEYADFHEYIEDMFQLPGFEGQNDLDDLMSAKNSAPLDPEQIERAKEVARHFYNSQIWRRSLRQREPINLNGYIQVIYRVLNRSCDEILADFKAAHRLGYVTIFQPFRQVLCIKGGKRIDF